MHEKLIILGKENDTDTRCWKDITSIMAAYHQGQEEYTIKILCNREKFVPLYEDVIERFSDKDVWSHRHKALMDGWQRYLANE